jgi:hypothetical protein
VGSEWSVVGSGVAEARIAVPPTRVFWEKRLQAVEDKGQGLEKESQEAASD